MAPGDCPGQSAPGAGMLTIVAVTRQGRMALDQIRRRPGIGGKSSFRIVPIGDVLHAAGAGRD